MIYAFVYHYNFDYIKYTLFDVLNNIKEKENIVSDKWIVITVFNPPSSSIFNLQNRYQEYKIVIIGNNQSNDNEWKIFQSSKRIFYLSIEKQNNLNYTILKFFKPNSYFRKSIGYLYAIQNGAKEIYEIDEELEFDKYHYINNNFENKYISYVSIKDNSMTNPYPHFGYTNIWPRGFKINDIGRQTKNNFNIINSTNLYLKPLIFQGLINFFPDIDSIFSLTRKKFENIYDFKISNSNPLLYFPNNFIPINSKNTRYLYEIFPLLIFPISFYENIADIWRGYLMQYFAWLIGGGVIYHITGAFRRSFKKGNHSFLKEKKNFHLLNKFLYFLYAQNLNDAGTKMNTLKILNNFLKMLIDNNIFQKLDQKIYHAYLKDLKNIGYNFSFFSNIKKYSLNNYRHLKIKSEFKLYIPSSLFIIKNSNLKLMNHLYTDKKYEDILLIINYNIDGFLKLNNYITNLYHKQFPNIVFINPSITKEPNIISCNNSYEGYYSYNCFKKVYQKYPKYKGYLYINDDLFLKFWELQNFNFSIPWLNEYGPISKTWLDHYSECVTLYNIFNNKIGWKNNIISCNGFFEIMVGMSDFFYLPNYYASKICNIFDTMFKSKIFLECAIPNSMGILLASKYQIIKIKPLWKKERENSINYLYNKYDQIVVHPIKLSNLASQINVTQYISFVNAIEY